VKGRCGLVGVVTPTSRGVFWRLAASIRDPWMWMRAGRIAIVRPPVLAAGRRGDGALFGDCRAMPTTGELSQPIRSTFEILSPEVQLPDIYNAVQIEAETPV